MKFVRAIVRTTLKITAATCVSALAISLYGCDPDSWNKPNNPKDVPSSYGPCGVWPDCGPSSPPAERCCYPTTKCWTEADGSLSCVGDSSYDPSNPVIWGKMKNPPHYKRLPARDT